MAYDASPSWSGFNYQGKVALYYVLCLINEKALDYDFSNYELFLENTEDFEVKESSKTLTFHQVKAYQNSSFSAYSKALIGIALELYRNADAQAYIHTWKNIDSKAGKSFEDSIASDIDEIISEYRACTKRDGKTVVEQAISDKDSISKIAALIRRILKQSDADFLVAILEKIRDRVDGSLHRIRPYEYKDGNKFCDLDEINNKIKEELSFSFAARKVVATEEQIDKAFLRLLGEIDKHIIIRHKNFGLPVEPIGFDKISTILGHDFEDVSEDYFAYKFKNQFLSKFHEFMGSELYSEPKLDEGYICNLRSIYSSLSMLDARDLWDHYRNFSPHEYIEPLSNLDAAFKTDLQGVLLVLLKIFDQIDFSKSRHDQSNKKITYRKPNDPVQHYLPTTIHAAYPASMIAKKIFNNPNMIDVLYEIDTLIYDGAPIYKLASQFKSHTTAPSDIEDDQRQKRENVLENIRLIPVQMAKDELDAH